MHVIFVRSPDFPNETVKAIRNILRRPKTLSVIHPLENQTTHERYYSNATKKTETYSPSSQPSRQISHGRSASSPRSFLKARISFVTNPSYKP